MHFAQAIHRHFQGATWQRCQTHFMRNNIQNNSLCTIILKTNFNLGCNLRQLKMK
uniref:transposase n=1 Tax=Thermoanaerobacter uzonensis TaxID=447593 RepID=UPI001F45BF15|nr:transposase [Thermoanaerobacter uzonensis]